MEDLKNIIKIVGCLVGGLLFFYFYFFILPSMNEAKYCNFYLNMNNMLTLTPGGRESKCYMTIDQKANYSRRKQNSIFYSALMAESWEIQEQMWNHLFPISTGELYKNLINRVESKSQNDLKSWLASLDYSSDFIVNEAGDLL